MIPLKVLKISYNPSSRSYCVILKEMEGKRCLPVIIGSFEAQSIALAIEVVETPRPLTHDLICDIISGINGIIKAVRINHLDNGVFYSQIELESDKFDNLFIDSRPSDSIAIALRLNAPILVTPEILLEAGIEEKSLVKDMPIPKENKKNLSLNTLRAKLKSAIDEEEYEIAARLRDKISKLKS